jgi:hypothetical protein
VTTDSAQSTVPTQATVFGTVSSDGGATITARGFALSLSSTLATGVSTTTVSGTTGSFNYSSTTLAANTTYFYRAYATNAQGTAYGSIRSFVTGNATPARRMRLFEGFTIKLFNAGKLKVLQQ